MTAYREPILTTQKQVDTIDMKAIREESRAVERLRKAAEERQHHLFLGVVVQNVAQFNICKKIFRSITPILNLSIEKAVDLQWSNRFKCEV